MSDRIFTHQDEVVETQLRASTYEYGGGVPGVGAQLTLESDNGVMLSVRLPAEVARALAASLRVSVQHPDDVTA